jgi:hypothetical protein
VGEERAFRLAGAFDLPERVAAVADAGNVVKRADVGEEGDFFFVEGGDAEGEIVDGGKGAAGAAGYNDGFADLLAESPRIAEAEAKNQSRVWSLEFRVWWGSG